MKTLRVKSRAQWRAWLAKHHQREGDIWLVFPKACTGQSILSYDESVEDALCFGWIDSLIKRIDDDDYARKFSPRRSGSVWSEANKKRVEKMISEDLMTEAGMLCVSEARASGEWDRKRLRPQLSTDEWPTELKQSLEAHPKALEQFHKLAPTYQKQYVVWIATAVRAETRQRRTKEATEKLERGERLGLK